MAVLRSRWRGVEASSCWARSRATVLLVVLIATDGAHCATGAFSDLKGPAATGMATGGSHMTGQMTGRSLAQSGPRAIGYNLPNAKLSLPAFRMLERIRGQDWDMPGGWWPMVVDYKFPEPDHSLGSELSCLEHGQSVVQPMDELYKRRHAPPSPLPGNVPRAFWAWHGSITRKQFDAVPDDLRGPDCLHCLNGTRYQIIDGHLYRKGTPEQWKAENRLNLEFLEDLMLVAIHLWDLPDMDFIMHNGAGCPPEGFPLLSWNLCRGRQQAGFGWPYINVWRYALSPAQNEAYHRCMLTRYKIKERHQTVFWRGSNTDPNYGGAEVTVSTLDKMPRFVVHNVSKGDPDMDVKLSALLEDAGAQDPDIKALVGPLGKDVHREACAKSSIMMDMDGHGMSGRFGHVLVHFGGIVLKQASNHTAFFEHLVAPGYMVELYKNDASDFKQRSRQLLDEWRTKPERLMKQAEQLQGFAAAVMHNVAIAEAAAYSLYKYAQKLSWKTVRDPSYSHVPFSRACLYVDINRLPEQLCQEMQARPPRP